MNKESKYVVQAREYFCNNFNCSQAVFATFATEMGFDKELALKLATQFGGGARKGEMCGAVAGALMVLGLKYGHCHSDDNEEKMRAYQMSEDFMNRFIEAKGTVVCRELLGYDIGKAEDMAKIKELDLFKTICPSAIECATTIVEKMLEERRLEELKEQ